MAGHEGACFSPGRADSLILLPFLSWTRRQMSGKLVHIDFLNCPHSEDRGWGTLSAVGQRLSALHVHQTPWGKMGEPGPSGGLDGPEPAFLTGSWVRRKLHSEDHCLDRVVKFQELIP